MISANRCDTEFVDHARESPEFLIGIYLRRIRAHYMPARIGLSVDLLNLRQHIWPTEEGTSITCSATVSRAELSVQFDDLHRSLRVAPGQAP
jgi:hypothetical protein